MTESNGAFDAGCAGSVSNRTSRHCRRRLLSRTTDPSLTTILRTDEPCSGAVDSASFYRSLLSSHTTVLFTIESFALAPFWRVHTFGRVLRALLGIRGAPRRVSGALTLGIFGSSKSVLPSPARGRFVDEEL
jgi:hypothetical protein